MILRSGFRLPAALAVLFLSVSCSVLDGSAVSNDPQVQELERRVEEQKRVAQEAELRAKSEKQELKARELRLKSAKNEAKARQIRT
ncbi:hypothetical protein [Hymenobacter weizhouensis]|uniref:hypothetical protein n=1 Tax=Hymenobacter sp. YIM 151500-1 TaxID=2987689 RepID=UPI00222709CE|nr:hypothetical protein [Hymenobacter sp. YIM 151500-1]UYZ64361.1 hypothetical protein OIS53_05795 [Hymenobacter sp. YIM 151500-1]